MELQLFRPTERNILVEYPELKEYPEIAALTRNDYIFVWNWANKTSPHSKVRDSRERARRCYKLAYGDTHDGRHERFLGGDFPNNILEAIKIMEKFNPTNRAKAKTMAEKIFDTWKKIAERDMSKVTDLNELKQYAEITMKIQEGLPSLVRQLENGFGIREFDRQKDGKKEATFADRINSME